MSLQPGSRLGRYEIESLVGAGGMGEVYRARDTRLDRVVALKVLPAELAEDASYRQRLEREARTISQLQHPHVCTLHDFDSVDGTDFLVMEHLEGGTLADRLTSGPLPVDEMLRIGAQIAEAVDAAHRQGVVHRDLKPGNVMLTSSGVKVLDFGLARELGGAETVDTQAATAAAITGEGTLVGTMPYMAPEQLQGERADARTDVWALGCVLYEMATGERAFRGATQASLIGSIMEAQPEAPSRRRPLSPERLDEIVKRCLAKKPDERWQSARDVALELEAVHARGAATVTSAPPPRLHRRRDVMAAGAVLGLALLVALGWWLWSGIDDLPADSALGLGEVQVAVLPFESFTDDPELDALGIGIADDVITELAGVRQVATRNRSFPHAGEPVCDAATAIGALVMLEGAVRRVGDTVRVSAQYVRCPQGDHVWARTFDLPADGLLEAQDDAVRVIAGSANGALWTAERTTPGQPYWHLMQLTETDNQRALEKFQASAERNPADPQPPVGIYWVHFQRLTEGFLDEPPDVSIATMDRSAKECLERTPTYWLCYQVVGDVARVRGEREAWLAATRRADTLSGAISLDFTTGALLYTGAVEEALTRLAPRVERRGEDCCLEALAYAAFLRGDHAEAARLAEKRVLTGVNDDPVNSLAFQYQLLAASQAHLGAEELAREALAEAVRLRPRLSAERMGIVFSTWDREALDRYLEGLALAGLE